MMLFLDFPITIENIKNAFGLSFAHQIVVFRVPKHLVGDFLYSCVLYHEFGHFVDSFFHITDQVFDTYCELERNKKLPSDFYPKYYPMVMAVAKGDPLLVEKCIKRQTGEYVADLFGAQYVGEHICNLMEISSCGKYDGHDFDHPSPNYRETMVQDFLTANNANLVLSTIIDVFKSCGLDLKNRYVAPAELGELEKGKPITIANVDELHSIIKAGWDVYFSKPTSMEVKSSEPSGSLGKYDFYCRVNTSIKESIKNYFGY